MGDRDFSGTHKSAEHAIEDDWEAYYARLAGRIPRPLFKRVRSIYLAEGATRTAVDLGCGDGTETLAMLDDGLGMSRLLVSVHGSVLPALRRCPGCRSLLQALQQERGRG